MDRAKEVGSVLLSAGAVRSGWVRPPQDGEAAVFKPGDEQSEARSSDSGWKDRAYDHYSLRSKSLCSHLELSHQQQLGCHQFATGCVAMKSKAE